MSNTNEKIPLEALAARISTSATAITAFCSTNGHTHRSLSNHASSPSLLPPTAPEPLRVLQQDLLDAAWELQLLATDASEFFGRLAIQNQQLACLTYLLHFRIPSLLPHPPASIPYTTLATLTSIPADHLARIARMAMLLGFFSEPTPNTLSHSPLSLHITDNGPLLAHALFLTTASFPMAPRMRDAALRWPASRATNHTAYNLSAGTDLPLFAHVASDPALSALYAGYMRNVARSEGTSVAHLVTGFAWASLGAALLVDVGGSTGHASVAVARAAPRLRVVVQDLPASVAEVETATLVALEMAVRKRVRFQAHDFFSAQPKPEDWETEGRQPLVFLLRMILHDWSDEDCVVILRHLVDVLKERATATTIGGKDVGRDRIIIMDTVLPRPGCTSRTVEAVLRVRDLTMLQAHNAKERSYEEWVQLLGKANAGLRILGVVQPFGSVMAVMEVVYEPRKEGEEYGENVGREDSDLAR